MNTDETNKLGSETERSDGPEFDAALGSTIYVRANDPAARELLVRAVKWIERLRDRRDTIPHFFDNDTDPGPLAADIRRYLSN